jgi:hypothetical protein
MGTAAMKPVATDLTNPSLPVLAEDFGVGYRRLDRAAVPNQALANLWRRNTRRVVDVSEDDM